MHTLELYPAEYSPPSTCWDFGLSAALVPLLGETIAPVAAGALEGAGGGALFSGLTGGDPLTGALTGGATGGIIPAVGPELGSTLGIGTTGGEALAGLGAGAAGQAITGGSLKDIALGGAAGAGAGLLSGSMTPTTGVTTPSVTAPTAATGGGIGGVGNAPAAIADIGGLGGSIAPGATAATGAGGDITSSVLGDWSARPAAGGTAAGSTGTGGGVGNWLSTQFDKLMQNPLSIAGLGLMGANVLMGDKPVPAQSKMQGLAEASSKQALGLESYLQTGTLPPGLQASVDRTQKASEAAIRQRFASMGMSGSTSEVQAINDAKQAALVSAGDLQTKLYSAGIEASKLSETEWAAVLDAQLKQDAAFNSALGTFSLGLAGARTGGTAAGTTA